MFQLFDYQDELVNKIYDAWEISRYVLAVSPTGSGKTVVFSHIIAEENTATCAIAHRQELVSQIALALARNGVRHRIIAGKDTIRDCITVQMDELGRSFYDANNRVAVAGVDTIIRMDPNDPFFKAVQLVVMDECFIAGTLIDGKPIETLKVGDYVTAFNEQTGEFGKKQIIRLFKNKQPKNMVRIATSTHHVLYCTLEHPIWTRRGWIAAKDVLLTDEVLYELHTMRNGDNQNQRSATLSFSKNWPNILPHILRNETSRSTTNFRMVAKKTAATVSELFYLWKTSRSFWAPSRAAQNNWSGVLFYRLFKGISSQSFISNNEQHEQTIRKYQDEDKQSYVETGIKVKNESHFETNETSTNCSWWEWKTTNRCRNYVTWVIQSSWIRIATCYKNISKTWLRLSTSIQAGFRKLSYKTGNRSRRWIALWRTFVKRCEKRSHAKFVGLDSVEIFESRNIKQLFGCVSDGYVYNIEVDDWHTYTANGIIVHNCHHVLKSNKWGKAVEMFTGDPKVLGVTATAFRADGRGLGRHHDGIFEIMVMAIGMREIINRGKLTDYKVFMPTTMIDLSDVPVSAGGDYSPNPLRKAVHKSRIIGDCVHSYTNLTPGTIGITFCVDVEAATEQALAYRHAGIPAEVVTAKTPSTLRSSIMRKLARGDLKEVTNVDLFGEGFDAPAIETVHMARPSKSMSLVDQQFGRALRRKDGKQFGSIVDHVGNIMFHKLPDGYRPHSLDRREKRSRSVNEVESLRVCPNCTAAYERLRGPVCPYCSYRQEPQDRSSPAQVDGDLTELSMEALHALRGQIEAPPTFPVGATREIVGAIRKRHREKLETIEYLRTVMMQWAAGKTDIPKAQREFYLTFGVDILTAQTLNKADAEQLIMRIYEYL